MTNPHEAALEAAARALDGTGLLEGDESRPASQAAITAYLTSMREVGRVMVPVAATEAMLDKAYECYNANGGSLHMVYIDMVAARPKEWE